MTDTPESTKAAKKRGMTGTAKLLAAGAVVIGVGALYALMPGDGEAVSMGTTYTATRGPMEILVMQKGDVIAQRKQAIRSTVEKGGTTTLFLVE